MAKIPVRTMLTQAGNELNQQLAKQSAAWNQGTGNAQNEQKMFVRPAASPMVGNRNIASGFGLPRGSGFIQGKNQSAPQGQPVQIVVQSSGEQVHNMEPTPLQAEPLVPQKLVPQSMAPDNEIPEGESAFDTEPAVKPQAPPESATLRYLTHICNQGLSGAIITNEILEPPLAMRQGYLSRYRRRGR